MAKFNRGDLIILKKVEVAPGQRPVERDCTIWEVSGYDSYGYLQVKRFDNGITHWDWVNPKRYCLATPQELIEALDLGTT